MRALLEATALLGQIADHMCAYRDAGLSSPDAPPPAEVLRRLLTEMLAPELTRRAADVKRATDVVRTATEAVDRETYLVAIDDSDDTDSGPAVWN